MRRGNKALLGLPLLTRPLLTGLVLIGLGIQPASSIVLPSDFSVLNTPVMPIYVDTLPRQTHRIRQAPTTASLIPPLPTPINPLLQSVPKLILQSVPKPVLNQPIMPLTLNTPIMLDTLFESSKVVVLPEFYARIKAMAQLINEYDADAIIEVHTDSQGDSETNLAISQAQADTIKHLLATRYKVNPDKIEAIGYGDIQPVASNQTQAGRLLNRRVIAIIVQPATD